MFTLQKLICDLSKVDRNHHILNSDDQENDVEHSFAVALLCWYICDRLNLKLDMSKVLKYALIHDFAEVYAGDINTFASKQDRERKIELEAKAISKLRGEIADFTDFSKTLQNYESKKDDESLFVWTVDKMQALVLADLDNWRPYQKIDISYDSFARKHHEQLDNCSAYCKEIYKALLEYCKTTYYDKPRND